MDDERHAAFLRAWLQAQPAVAAYALSRLGDPHAMDDVVQEVALSAQRCFATYDARRSFTQWVLGITHHKIIDHFRARRPNESLESDEAERHLHEASLRLADEIGEQTSAMQDCIAKLPPQRRELLRRYYLDGESVREITRALRMGQSAVKVALHRLRQALRDCVDRTLAREGAR